MSKYRFVAIDLDDTLLNEDLSLSERSIETISRVKDAGVHVTLATGRMFCSAKKYAQQIGIDIPLITYQGALVKSPCEKELVLHRPVPLNIAHDVINDIKKHGDFHVNVYLDDKLYTEKMTEAAVQYQKISQVEMNIVGDLLKFLKEPPTKVLVSATEEEVDYLINELKPIYQKELHVTKSKPYFLEFSHPKANKGDVLEVLVNRLDVEREQIIAIGDSYNDVEMLKYAGMGVVVGNARDEIKKLADYVAPPNVHDGVAKALEDLVLK